MTRWERFTNAIRNVFRPSVHVHHHYYSHTKEGHISEEGMRRIHDAFHSVTRKADKLHNVMDEEFRKDKKP